MQESQPEPDHTAALLTPRRKLIQFRADLKKSEKLKILNEVYNGMSIYN